MLGLVLTRFKCKEDDVEDVAAEKPGMEHNNHFIWEYINSLRDYSFKAFQPVLAIQNVTRVQPIHSQEQT